MAYNEEAVAAFEPVQETIIGHQGAAPINETETVQRHTQRHHHAD